MYAIWLPLHKVRKVDSKETIKKLAKSYGEPDIVLTDRQFFLLEFLMRNRIIEQYKQTKDVIEGMTCVCGECGTKFHPYMVPRDIKFKEVRYCPECFYNILEEFRARAKKAEFGRRKQS